MTETKVILNVSGGCVQDVFCSDPAVEVVLEVIHDLFQSRQTERHPRIIAYRNVLSPPNRLQRGLETR